MIQKNHSLGWQNVEKLSLKTQNTGDSLVVHWLGLSTFSTKGPGGSLIRELRSCKLHDAGKRKHHGKMDTWKKVKGLPCWICCSSNDTEYSCHTGEQASIPELAKSPGQGNGNLLQDSCLDRGAC